VAASADKIEMSGAAFVSICVKAHGGVPFCAVGYLEKISDRPRVNKRPIGLYDTTFSDRGGTLQKNSAWRPAAPAIDPLVAGTPSAQAAAVISLGSQGTGLPSARGPSPWDQRWARGLGAYPDPGAGAAAGCDVLQRRCSTASAPPMCFSGLGATRHRSLHRLTLFQNAKPGQLRADRAARTQESFFHPFCVDQAASHSSV
jgi:hypothetical protein